MLLSLFAQVADPTVNVQAGGAGATANAAVWIASLSMFGQVMSWIINAYTSKTKLKYDTEAAVKTALLEKGMGFLQTENDRIKADFHVLQVAHDKCEHDHNISLQHRATLQAKVDLQEKRLNELTGRVDVAHSAATTAARAAAAASTAVAKAVEEVPQRVVDRMKGDPAGDSKHD